MKSPIALRRSEVQLPNTFDVNIFLHPSAPNPDGPDPPLVLIAAFLINSSFYVVEKIRMNYRWFTIGKCFLMSWL